MKAYLLRVRPSLEELAEQDKKRDKKPLDVEVEIRTRDGVITTPCRNVARALAVSGVQAGKKLFHLEVR